MFQMIENIKSYLSKPEVISVIQSVLVVIIAVFSAVCTYNLTMNTFDSKPIAAMLTIIVEASLTLFSFKFHKHSFWYVLIWVPYLIVSIIASQGAVIGDTATKTAEKVHTSPEYKNYESGITSLDAQIATYQNRLNNVASNDNTEINKLNEKIEQKRDELKRTISTPKTQRLRSDIKKEIDSLETSKKQIITLSSTSSQEAENIRKSIEELNDDKAKAKQDFETDLNKIGGVSSAFKASLFKIGISEINFWTAFFILLEITRFVLLRDSKKINAASTSNPPQNKKSIPEPEQKSNHEQPKKLQVAHAGNILSFASKGYKEVEQAKKEQTLSKSNITKYINEMYKLHEQEDSFGYKKIAGKLREQGIQITDTACYKIRNHLEELDVIDGTKIIMSKDKALLAIRKGA